MLFKKQTKNRRLEREHVLDVKLHSRHRRAHRVRIATTAFSILMGTTVSFYLIWRTSHWALNEWIFTNPAFNITRLEIDTNGLLSLSQLQQWAGVKEGDNLLAVDLSRIKRDLELQSLIHSVAVERILPATLRIHVREREPVAKISGFRSGSHPGEVVPALLYIDAEGYVMRPAEVMVQPGPVSLYFDSMPVLTGVPASELLPGHRVHSPQLHAALRLIVAFERSSMARRVELSTVDLSNPPILKATTRHGSEILFAAGQFPRQLQRWQLVHEHARQDRKSIQTLDLSVANNVPVRWQTAEPAAPPASRGLQPSPYRKRHV